MREAIVDQLDFEKGEGLIPAIIQDADTRQVLMLGYMNREALEHSRESGRVTFFSRSKGRLWTKGESSGNFLDLVDIAADCDGDSLLVKARPHGSVCHTGTATCFEEENSPANFLHHLEKTIHARQAAASDESYTASLFKKGLNKIAQKVGEEAVELVIEAKDDNKDLFLGEAADFQFHFLVLLCAKGYRLEEVMAVLRKRHQQAAKP